MYVCMYVCMYVYIYLFIYFYLFIFTSVMDQQQHNVYTKKETVIIDEYL